MIDPGETGRRAAERTLRGAAVEAARVAWDRGQAALAAADGEAALRWLDRAQRIAPQDDTIALGLATACLASDPARAVDLFARVTAAHDVREAWLGLAVARLRCGEAAAAAAALSRALSRHAAPDTIAAVGDAVVGAAGRVGWCGVPRPGFVAIALAGGGGGPVEVGLDGDAPIRLRCGAGPPAARRLPPGWQGARWLHVGAGGRALLGSPIDLAAIRRVEGCVEWRDGALHGWAWHPGDPDRDPILRALAATGAGLAIALRTGMAAAAPGTASVLHRPRSFTMSAARLARLGRPIRVVGQDGADLLGSPLGPAGPSPAPAAPPHPVAPRIGRRGRGIDVVVPVRDGGTVVLDCLDSVLATIGRDMRLVVVDDGSRDPGIVARLDALARARRIRLVRHAASLGFPRSANAGLRATGPGRDTVLLNSDTLVPPLWLERLRAAAYAAPDIGTTCPLSNNATILSYPEPGRPAPMPDLAGTARLAARAHRANAGQVVDIPTAVGFCMFIRRDCRDAVGLFREDAFAQGYGEENDFCMRARGLGWRHVAAPGVFVAHRGALSFAGAGAHLAARNAAALRALHPDHDALVAAFVAADPLAPARRRLDARSWRRSGPEVRAAVLVSHDQGGGVERHLRARCAALAREGCRPVVLRPGAGRAAVVGDGAASDHPNLRFALPGEMAGLARFLARQRPERVEFHHLLDHHPDLMALPARLGVPYDVSVHDHAWFCPRVTLLGGAGRYCGEPDTAGCETCVAAHGSALEEAISVAALRSRNAAFLRGARRVTAPSADAASRLRRHFSLLAVEVAPHEPDPAPVPRRTGAGARTRVCVVGGISAAKGYAVLREAVRDAAARRLPLDFIVVGVTEDDAALMATGQVFVTGPYAPDEAVGLIAAQRADLALLPTIVPETWCYTLGEAWRAGLDVMAFDIGAQAERIRRTGRGWLVPLGLSAAALNDALLAAARQTGHEWPRQHTTVDCVMPAC